MAKKLQRIGALLAIVGACMLFGMDGNGATTQGMVTSSLLVGGLVLFVAGRIAS